MPTHQKRQPTGRTANGSSTSDDAGNRAEAVAPAPASTEPPPAPPKGPAPQPPPQPKPGGDTLKITDLKDLSIQKLTQIAKDKNVVGATGMRKQDLIFQILKAQTEQSGFIFS
ncbi:MAG TPA: Rho termination factor N-terminal domain-containing protein, partial [Vicinamibacterales bacterium]|nr:Rho termination factor N-terminal domain-containing protein [Vicinamibacterales bacterium]